MEFEFEPTAEETRQACAAIARAVLPKSRGNAILFGVYVLVGAASALFASATASATIVISIGGILVTLGLLQRESRRRLSAVRAADPHGEERQFVELTPEVVHAWCAHIDSRYAWAEFTKVTEDSRFYLLCRPGGGGTAIPKRILDRVTEAALRARLREWAPDHGASLTHNSSEVPAAVI